MRFVILTAVSILIAAPSHAVPGNGLGNSPIEAVIVDQPIDVNITGEPVDVNITGEPVEVIINDQPLDVTTVAGSGISHQGRPVTENIQLQATSLPIATAAILSATRISATGGGSSYDLPENQCLVLTELDIVYQNAGSNIVNFRLGLVDSDKTTVWGRRLFASNSNADGFGSITRTFPSGLVLRRHPSVDDGTRLGLETFDARVVNFAASGYVMPCF